MYYITQNTKKELASVLSQVYHKLIHTSSGKTIVIPTTTLSDNAHI